MPIELATVLTAGSMTHIRAPMLYTADEDRLSTPANSDVISIIRNTAKVMPTSKPLSLALSLTSSL